ncbi:MAG: aspartate kinase [Bacteroidales bacterium]|nr:aspartate kinase [Bacteroidales bacterium]
MKIFKFGGASVTSAAAVKNVAGILSHFAEEQLILVFSAMGKTTNALEKVVNAAFYKTPDLKSKISLVKDFHVEIVKSLFDQSSHSCYEQVSRVFKKLEALTDQPDCSYDEFYDRIVPLGEILTTTIISNYLTECGLKNSVIQATEMIATNNRFRDAAVDWIRTEELITRQINATKLNQDGQMMITQGFIGFSTDGKTTTLGREGSDFTASILAYCLNAEEVIVWKDVDGLLNADPACFSETVKIDHISYYDVIELAFYGAKILHPKTIKPLQNKSIPLRIKSFFHPLASGTLIDNHSSGDTNVPFFIKKQDQALVSFVSKDFSFIAEDKLYKLFGVFDQLNLKINLMQNAAISFTIITNDPADKMNAMLDELKNEFDIRYNRGLELLTIRNFNDLILDVYFKGKSILLEQRSRRTIQVAYLPHSTTN